MIKFKEYDIEQDGGMDDYGQSGQPEYLKKCKIFVSVLSSVNVDDVRYKDCTHLGLTKDRTLQDNMHVKVTQNLYYKIKITNNDSPNYAQLILQEVRP